MQSIIDEIVAERQRQKDVVVPNDNFDAANSQGDWVSFITAYAGRASQRVFRNKREGQGFRSCMVKVAATAIAAIEQFDAGNAQD